MFQLENAFEFVPAKTCQKVITKVRTVEDTFWKEDVKLESLQENSLL